MKIKLGIADDDLLVLQLLSDFFNHSDQFEVCLTASGGNVLIEELERISDHPDVLLLDLRMNDGNGIEVLEYIRQKELSIKTIVLTSFYKPSFIGQMMKLNVSAFLPKEIDRHELFRIIRTVHEKGYYFWDEQLDALRSQVSSRAPKINLSGNDLLSARESDVLKLLCQQYTTQGIAEKLFVSNKTVESHKSNLLAKTGVKNMAGLVIYAIQNGIVNADEIILMNR